MSALPPDPAKWPDDPYELFNVTYEVTRKDLRRRYSELIRQYKPEHAPREFRRIRDAFEVLQQRLQWREQLAAWSSQQAAQEDSEAAAAPSETTPAADETARLADAFPDPSTHEATTGPDIEKDEAPPASAASALEPNVVDAELVEETVINAARSGRSRQALGALIEDAWNVARSGDPQVAYCSLVELHQQHAGDEEVCVRLYWLLRFWPGIDAQRRPADWLYGPLIRHGLAGRVTELLGSHFEDDPAAALDPRCDELLQCNAPPWKVLELAVKRWQAVATLGRAEVIAADLAALCGRLEEKETTREWWARALISAVDVLAWTPGRAAVATLDSCQRTLAELDELQLSLSHELDRCDLLRELSAGFAALRALDDGTLARMGARRHELAALEGLLARWWRLTFPEVRRETARRLHPWVVDPHRGVAFFGHLRQRAAILSQVGDLIDAWHRDRATDAENPADETARPAVVRFFNRNRTHPYEAICDRLLIFCIDEWIWPPQIMALLGNFPPPADAWLAALDADLPLRYLCQAYEAAWS